MSFLTALFYPYTKPSYQLYYPMPKVNIKVVVRLRPVTQSSQAISISKDAINIQGPKAARLYRFDKVLDQNTQQQQLYSQAGISQMVKHVIDGYSSTVFAFGQTSAGKTYTMQGYQYDPKRLKPIININSQGLIQRAIRDLYRQMKRKNNSAVISCSFLQIYNQKLYDLLKPVDMCQSLKLRWDKEKEFSVQNLSDVICHTDEQMINIWHEGIKKRVVAGNNLNIASSRSHTIFRVSVETTENQVSYISRLQLVDLAGSERSQEGKPSRETIEINKSLFTLKKIINSLVAEELYVPYRESKLTSLLKHSLGGNSYCTIIACINPADQFYQHTISTLEYAAKAKTIMNSIEQTMNTKDKVILSLKQDNAALREELKVAQKEIQDLTKATNRSVRIPQIDSSPRLIQTHNNQSPGPDYFSHRLVQSINTVRELLKSNKMLRDDLDQLKRKSQEYSKQITMLVTQNQYLKTYGIDQQQVPVSLGANRLSQTKTKRSSVSKIVQREKQFREQLQRLSHRRVVTQHNIQASILPNISLPKMNKLN